MKVIKILFRQRYVIMTEHPNTLLILEITIIKISMTSHSSKLTEYFTHSNLLKRVLDKVDMSTF